MKILLSCFACRPYAGSEPGVGWNWAFSMSKYHDVCVLTRKQNKVDIEKYKEQFGLPFEVVYFGLPFFERIRKFPFRESLYSLFWQRNVLSFAEELHKKNEFDICHHCTYATFKFPSRLYKLGIPFVLGPVGGGEKTPVSCKHTFTVKGRIKELIHDSQITLRTYARSSKEMFRNADKILVATNETLLCVPEKYHSKTMIMQTIAVRDDELLKHTTTKRMKSQKCELLCVAKLEQWKGYRLLIDIIKELDTKYPGEFHLNVIGDGPDNKSIFAWKSKEGLGDSITFLGNISRSEVLDRMNAADIFVYPSFHDSGAMVVLEAMANRLPVVVLGAGGPAVNVNESTGSIISPDQKYTNIVEEFVKHIVGIRNMYSNDAEYLAGRLDAAEEYIRSKCTWDVKAREMCLLYEEVTKDAKQQ